MEILSNLNPQQKEAVTYGDGPLLVLAGAGSGKTRVLTHRIAYLIAERGVSPANILAVTFTNKAAGEMKERVEKLLGYSAERIWVSTFHSACVRILRADGAKNGLDPHFVIYDSSDQIALVKEVLKELNINDKNFPPRSLLEAISKAKNELKTPEEYSSQAGDFWEQQVERVYKRYQERLKENKALDFDDLIMETTLLFKEQPYVLDYYQERFRYLLVDEYQDTNKAQYELVKLLAAKYRNLCVVGDDNQSIYGWRGADIENILAFERDYPDAKVIKLEQNYRSTGTILDAANSLIQYNIARTDKKLWTDRGRGEPIKVYWAADERDEARYVVEEIAKLQREGYRNQDMAILYRTNAQSRPFEEAFLYAGIPYQVVGSLRFYDRKEIKDIIAYLRVIYNPADNISLQRIINVPKRGIGAATYAKLEQLAAERGQSVYDALLDIAKGKVDFPGRTQQKLVEFVTFMEQLRAKQEETPLTSLVEELLELSGYRAELQQTKDEHAKGRLENISEFLSATQQYDRELPGEGVGLFLEQLALLSDPDTYDEGDDSVTLMTLHSAKGLEFPVVFLAGLEEGIFPHARSIWEMEQLEEERRLCYVGVTRAQERLYLTSAGRRTIFGTTENRLPSRFLEEIPGELKEEIRSPALGGRISVKSSAKPEPRAAAGQSIYRKPTSQPAGFVPGQKVVHTKWGTGTVVKVDGQGPDAVLVVAFPGEGVKKLLAGFAPLKNVN
ncbi:MAG: DNA helicase PcrA [Firmicutes bacterium]|nr:DNA helicase PcrA [Bacillota bacterium]